MNNWIEKEIPISEIEHLLNSGYEIQVESADGFVPVSLFVDKGNYEEYILTTETNKQVRCNHNHLFETPNGFVFAKDFPTEVITKDGVEKCEVLFTGKSIPIVDIRVEHENHRYYTEGVSSHNTGVGKSLCMCSIASSVLLSGKNVLYITMEMAEERIAERIDANLLNSNIQDIPEIPKQIFTTKVKDIQAKTHGQLFIKEYPTASAHAGHFDSLLKELTLKKSFKPDIIFIDYINICLSQRYTGGASVNSYTVVKAIAEELRGLAVKYNVPVFSATQTTRGGFASSDPTLTDTSESFGLPATADLMFALISTDDLDSMNQIMIKQLKNRYNDATTTRKFVVGIDRAKMRLFDVEQSAQNGVADSEITETFKPNTEKFASFSF